MEALHNNSQTHLQETKHVLKDLVEQEIHDIKDIMTKSKVETRDMIDGLRSFFT